jgi:hypothetical protein
MVIFPEFCLFESITPAPQRVSGGGGYFFKNQEVMPVACKKTLMATESTEEHGKTREKLLVSTPTALFLIARNTVIELSVSRRFTGYEIASLRPQ